MDWSRRWGVWGVWPKRVRSMPSGASAGGPGDTGYVTYEAAEDDDGYAVDDADERILYD